MNNNVLLIWDRMGDYHRARWAALKESQPQVKVYGADLGSSDTLYGWKDTEQNPYYFRLSSKPPDQIDLGRIIKFIRILSAHKIDTICVSGYGKLEYLIFILYGKLTKRKVILFAESWYPSNFIVDKLKSLFLRATCHGFLVSGSRAFNHFTKRLHISPEKIKIGYSVVDNNHFRNNTPRDFVKRILSVARFAPEKNLSFLIQAFLESNLSKEDWELLIVGGGPLAEALKAQVAGNSNIKLWDWKSYEDLPSVYHQSSVFVLSSVFEPWGLVVNEAMAAGLPVLLSDAVGCSADVLVEGENGWLSAHDKNELVSRLNSLSTYSSEEYARMGKKSEDIVTSFSLKTFSDHLKLLMDRRF